jgi:hypothetical protein
LHIASLERTSTPRYNPESYGRYGENAGKADKPQGEICNGVIVSLFPESVPILLFDGMCIGLAIVGGVMLWGRIHYSPRNTPTQSKPHDRSK